MSFVPFTPMDNDLESYGEIVSVEFFKALTDNLNYLMDSSPVGEITPIFVVTGINEPDPRFWQECNNTPITDLISPLRGYNTPDMISAIGTINFLTFRAKVAGTVTVTYVDKIPGISAIAASRTLDGISYVAQTPGAAGNAITIRVVCDLDPAVHPTFDATVSVVGTAITIHTTNLLFPGPSVLCLTNRSQIVTAVNASAPAHALVQATLIATDQVAIEIPTTNLTGGANSVAAIGSAGNEVVTVAGQNIQVRLENNVSTIQGIYAKLQLSAPAMALVDISIPPGTPTTVQPAPRPTLSLSPGVYLKGANTLGTVGFPAGQNTKNLQHNHTGLTGLFNPATDADTDDDRWASRAHTHGISNDLNTPLNFEPAHARIKHYIKIN